MSKITLTPLVNLQNETTAVNAINANNAIIQAAFDNTLSRDGTSPNQMDASLDMNSSQIINQAAIISSTVATLPVPGVFGVYAAVADGAPGLAWGSTAVGGGSTRYLVWYNSGAWTVIGK